ncbi:MAG TPA: TauD/TfdA family dioxygenase [Myxococcota bacterium]|nr:TauD/TfdA family dioxygenase [Myxococcota bacterium]
MERAPGFEVRPLSPSIGAEIHGLDLAKPIDPDTFVALRRTFVDRKVIFFRDQAISTGEHVAFCRRFGALEVHPFAPHKDGFPEVMVIRHGPENRGKENTWHSDVTWRKEPSLGSALRAVKVPPIGGDTLFADMEAAYEGLSSQMKRMLDGLVAVHDFTNVFGRRMTPDKLQAMREEYPPAEHPVVRTHPESGRKSLYVNAAFTVRIQGMSPEESTRLLAYLYSRAAVPEIQCRFRWANDSIALWDNRACQHYAVSDYFPAERCMERVTICGDKPV